MEFTVTHDRYVSGAPGRVKVTAHGREAWVADPPETSGGRYDVTVAVDRDRVRWQRFTGHLESGRAGDAG